jgi:hypothetical protein
MQPWVHLDLSYPNFSDTLSFFGRSVAAERSGAHGHREPSESIYCTLLMLFDHGEHPIFPCNPGFLQNADDVDRLIVKYACLIALDHEVGHRKAGSIRFLLSDKTALEPLYKYVDRTKRFHDMLGTIARKGLDIVYD